MPEFRDNTPGKLDALNNWLGDVYGEETSFATLLIDGGFSALEIEYIKQDHLSEFLQMVLDLMAEYTDDRFSEGRNRGTMQLMMQCYGLIDGKPQDRYAIGQSVGVCGERIRQLVNQRMSLYHEPTRQAKFHDEFIAIGQRLLDNEKSSQE